MANPYLEKPKPSRSLPLFDLKRPRRAPGTLPKRRVQVRQTRPTRVFLVTSPQRIRLVRRCKFDHSRAKRGFHLLRLPRTAVGPLRQPADIGDDVGSLPLPISSWTALHLIASRPRSTKPLGYEACAVGPDEVSEESIICCHTGIHGRPPEQGTSNHKRGG